MSAPLLAVALAVALFALSKLIAIRAARLDGLRGTAGQWAAFSVGRRR